MNLPNTATAPLSDCISIPEHLKSKPVANLMSKFAGGQKLPARVSRLFQYVGIRLLGDLDGKRLSDFAGYRGCGEGTLWALTCMIFRALHPAAKPDLSALPFGRRDDTSPPLSLAVPKVARALRPGDLPISWRLESALNGLGIKCLGDLNGIPAAKVRHLFYRGRKTRAELQALFQRAGTGEFTLTDQQLEASTPADLLGLVDDLVSRLPDRQRQFLLLRFGADGHAPKSWGYIGLLHRVSYYSISKTVRRSLERIRRQGSAKLQRLIARFLAPSQGETPWSADLLATWIAHTHPPRYSLQFYVRIIPKLRPNVGVNRSGDSESAETSNSGRRKAACNQVKDSPAPG
jgi:hypothetical protein